MPLWTSELRHHFALVTAVERGALTLEGSWRRTVTLEGVLRALQSHCQEPRVAFEVIMYPTGNAHTRFLQ